MLCGRTVDLHLILSQQISGFFRSNLDEVLLKFESSDLCALPELTSLLANIRQTHELMAPLLMLDPFEVLDCVVFLSTPPSFLSGPPKFRASSAFMNCWILSR